MSEPASDEADARWTPLRVGIGLALPVAVLALIPVLRWWQRRIWGRGDQVNLDGAPLLGEWVARVPMVLVVALVGAAALVRWWPGLTRSLRWGVLLGASWVVSVLWALGLALPGGWRGLGEPLETEWEYLPLARTIDAPGTFVAGFVENLRDYPIHVQGHPPGPVLGFWAFDRLGIGSASVMALILVALASLAAPLVLVASRALAGEAEARRVAVFVGLTPSALWVATTVDAVFAAVAVASGTALALAVVRAGAWGERPAEPRPVSAGAGLAALGGVLAGLLVLGTYGAALFLIPAGLGVVVLAWRRRWLPLAAAVLGAAAPLLMFAGAGYWIIDGLNATIVAYHEGVASRRPAAFFRLSNPLAVAIAMGPAVLASLPGRRSAGAWLLAGGRWRG